MLVALPSLLGSGSVYVEASSVAMLEPIGSVGTRISITRGTSENDGGPFVEVAGVPAAIAPLLIAGGGALAPFALASDPGLSVWLAGGLAVALEAVPSALSAAPATRVSVARSASQLIAGPFADVLGTPAAVAAAMPPPPAPIIPDVSSNDGLVLFDDFLALTGVGNTGWTVGANGAGSGVVQVAPALGDNVHPGVVQCSTGTTVGGRGVLSWGVTRHRIPAGVVGGRLVLETLVQIPTLATGAEDYFVNVGGSDNVGGGNPTQGIVFRYDFPGTTWNGVLRIGGLDVDVQIGPAVVAGQWARLVIDYDAAIGLRYFIAQPSPGPLVQIGSTVPLAVVDPLAAVAGAFAPQIKIQKQVGIAARTLLVDYVSFRYLVPGAR